MNSLIKFNYRNIASYAIRSYCSKIPVNVNESKISAQHQAELGVVYDKKPFKIQLEAGKNYSWCCCGKSKSQPLCDGTHKNVHLKIKLKPVRFQVEKSGDYWLCNCKQTKITSRPFCDGTHKTLT
ncbi:unnamed protein product [Diamesa serratosioi]